MEDPRTITKTRRASFVQHITNSLIHADGDEYQTTYIPNANTI